MQDDPKHTSRLATIFRDNEINWWKTLLRLLIAILLRICGYWDYLRCEVKPKWSRNSLTLLALINVISWLSWSSDLFQNLPPRGASSSFLLSLASPFLDLHFLECTQENVHYQQACTHEHVHVRNKVFCMWIWDPPLVIFFFLGGGGWTASLLEEGGG